jgi:hypothetical protein
MGQIRLAAALVVCGMSGHSPCPSSTNSRAGSAHFSRVAADEFAAQRDHHGVRGGSPATGVSGLRSGCVRKAANNCTVGTMMDVTTTGEPATGTEPARARLDRPILVSNIFSGALFLLPLAFPWIGMFGSWAWFLTGSAYVIAASVFLAAVYARDALTMRQEALAWIAPWLVAVVLWALMVARIDFENSVSGWLLTLLVGLYIGTPCYLGWQTVALAIRQLMAWRSRGVPSHS